MEGWSCFFAFGFLGFFFFGLGRGAVRSLDATCRTKEKKSKAGFFFSITKRQCVSVCNKESVCFCSLGKDPQALCVTQTELYVLQSAVAYRCRCVCVSVCVCVCVSPCLCVCVCLNILQVELVESCTAQSIYTTGGEGRVKVLMIS